jgi:hypothetical protein
LPGSSSASTPALSFLFPTPRSASPSAATTHIDGHSNSSLSSYSIREKPDAEKGAGFAVVEVASLDAEFDDPNVGREDAMVGAFGMCLPPSL